VKKFQKSLNFLPKIGKLAKNRENSTPSKWPFNRITVSWSGFFDDTALLPAKTRWGTYSTVINTFLQLQNCLQQSIWSANLQLNFDSLNISNFNNEKKSLKNFLSFFKDYYLIFHNCPLFGQLSLIVRSIVRTIDSLLN
jgi:hypothetical protein